MGIRHWMALRNVHRERGLFAMGYQLHKLGRKNLTGAAGDDASVLTLEEPDQSIRLKGG